MFQLSSNSSSLTLLLLSVHSISLGGWLWRWGKTNTWHQGPTKAWTQFPHHCPEMLHVVFIKAAPLHPVLPNEDGQVGVSLPHLCLFCEQKHLLIPDVCHQPAYLDIEVINLLLCTLNLEVGVHQLSGSRYCPWPKRSIPLWITENVEIRQEGKIDYLTPG
ncbi:hypothetical protein B0H13DRAFT_2330378 [Mycena leptocephala]|nr:hypothetical protein B0H13DRAFT_2330378 [Mycena leptocephala]